MEIPHFFIFFWISVITSSKTIFNCTEKKIFKRLIRNKCVWYYTVPWDYAVFKICAIKIRLWDYCKSNTISTYVLIDVNTSIRDISNRLVIHPSREESVSLRFLTEVFTNYTCNEASLTVPEAVISESAQSIHIPRVIGKGEILYLKISI